ncbi:MAG: hypothetical protein JWO72_56 [Caulobacteraceae bacterium]|nr:hypothetical protein [Caulobacteraceae bacterium]
MRPQDAPSAAPLSVLLAVGVLVAGMVSIQTGAALAKQLFPVVGAQGAVALRVAIAAMVLLALQRPWRGPLDRRHIRAVLLYGAALGAMNLLFYMSLKTVPLGVAVAIEFTGPLTVAVIASRRALDLAWVALAAAGLVLLAAPLGGAAIAADPLGALFALGAGIFWGLYIVLGKRAGEIGVGRAAALGMAVAALVATPFGIAHAGAALFAPALLPLAVAVALLSSAIPYSLEMFALVRLPSRTFGVLMSLEPVIATLSGLLMLGERLSPVQTAAIGCIVVASFGSVTALRAREVVPLP